MSTSNQPDEQTALLQQLVAQQQRQNLLLQNISIHLAKPAPTAARTGDLNAEWRKANPQLAASCREAATVLNKVFADYFQTLTAEIIRDAENFGDSEYTRNEFLDTCGPRALHLSNLLGLLSQLGGSNTQPATAPGKPK